MRTPDPELRKALGLIAALNGGTGPPLKKLELPLQIVDNRQYSNLKLKELLRLLPKRSNYVLLLVVDRVAISNPEHPVLVVDVGAKPVAPFGRCLPRSMP